MQGLPVSLSPGSDVMTERKKAIELLDAVLEATGPDTRALFVFFEIEKLSSLESTRLLEVPTDTVASRLRRARTSLRCARADFQARIQELERRTTETRDPTEESFDERSARLLSKESVSRPAPTVRTGHPTCPVTPLLPGILD
ncbi:MAG TPA: hypothetical protein VJT73_17305 [Polyangiaceae bacterium]|nr:hypothetical protein [Polyangiaceae bacterium]